MSEVNITVVGNVATEPKLDKNKNGDAFAHFRLACNNARYDARSRSWVDDDTSFYTVYCWRSPLADNIAASLHKGDPVVVYGRLKNREWRDKNEASRVSPEITARSLGHDLYRGTSMFTKVTRPPLIPDEDDAVENVREMYAYGADALGGAASGDTYNGIGNGMPGGNGIGNGMPGGNGVGNGPPGGGRQLPGANGLPGGGNGLSDGNGLPGGGLRVESGPDSGGSPAAGGGPSSDGGMRAAGEPRDADVPRDADAPAGPLANVTSRTRPASRSRREKAEAPA
ncbi:single-stranded DNA-binding protein [Jiangella mangrovi]|uniref:Single-stranded DNA-binding protein n=1 Tax=Jiangella mangrovi TaxID=1524084 RepID=A0A7W9GVC1_9ACTN|nr:single-stranded DNA-binding protein [Jiangella mangrovi]MBB5790729.1 single stranded DNA-binding protein [Jiangella mangrovi]